MNFIRRTMLVLAAMVGFVSTVPAEANIMKIDTISQSSSVIPEVNNLQNFHHDDFMCLALNIYHEARGESLIGQRAVAHVALNRSRNGKFPTSICGVIFQRSQFSWTSRSVGKQARALVPRERASWERAQRIAFDVLNGDPDPTNGATYFHAITEAGRNRHRVIIGKHVFSK